MATLNNIIGFETQNIIEASGSAGTPAFDTSVFHGNGKCALSLDAAADTYTLSGMEGGSSDAGNPYVVQFYYRTDTIASGAIFFRALTDIASTLISLVCNDSGGVLRVRDANATTYDSASGVLVVDTWHLIQIIWNQSDSGSFDVWVDGSSVVSSGTFDANTADPFQDYQFAGSASEVRRFDDVVAMSGATDAATDFFDEFEVYLYKGDTGATTVAGSSTLDAGAWSDVWELVHNDTNYAYYTNGAGAKAGGIDFDGGSTWSGPSGDANIDTIAGAKWIGRLRRENGSGTTHYMKIGNDSADGWTDKTVSLGTSFATYYHLSVSATEVPTSSEFARGGFGHLDDGSREIRLGEIYVNILNEISAAPVDRGSFFQQPPIKIVDEFVNYE